MHRPKVWFIIRCVMNLWIENGKLFKLESLAFQCGVLVCLLAFPLRYCCFFVSSCCKSVESCFQISFLVFPLRMVYEACFPNTLCLSVGKNWTPGSKRRWAQLLGKMSLSQCPRPEQFPRCPEQLSSVSDVHQVPQYCSEFYRQCQIAEITHERIEKPM